MNLLWTILSRGVTDPTGVAIIDDRRSMTWSQLLGAAMFVADAIDAQIEGDRVGVMLPTSGGFPICLLAGWMTKKTVVPLNYLLSPEDLQYVIDDSGVDAIITAEPMIEFLGGIDKFPKSAKLLMLETVDFTGMPPLRWPPMPARDDLAVLLYTSGTSGKPKGVMLTHGNLQSDIDGCVKHVGFVAADTFLGVLPQFHSFGLTALTLLPLYVGSTVVYSARFIPRKIIGLMKKHRPQVFMAVPSMYTALLSVKQSEADDYKSLTYAVSGGEPLPSETTKQFRERFNVQLLEGYGLTETSPVTHWARPQPFREGSVGQNLPIVTAVTVDDDNRLLPRNVEGEILVAGPNVMAGYYNLPAETAATFINLTHPETREPLRYFRTGDIGRIDQDGFLFITGRKKEMLIIAGENVFPREIEEVLNRHPSVNASAVIGKKDDMRGEIAVAFIELTEDAEFDEQALRAHCRENLAPFKTPREIHVIDELPRNPTGKIIRRQLKA